MNIFAIKQGYLLKSVFLMTIVCILSLGLIGGCSDGGGQNDSQALTENDFAENSSLRADLKGVIVTFLEAPNSEAPEKDTGNVGADEIPITYKKTVEQTFCWEDDDSGAMHFMELRDLEGNLILTVHVNGDCVTEVIEAGDYVLSIYNDGSNEGSLPIFLRPNPQASDQARKPDGLIDRFKLAASNIIKRMESTVTNDALAQTVMKNIDTLLSTNKCVECYLERANLTRASLIGADMSGAHLRNADLFRANLTDSTLIDANLRIAIMTGAILYNADLSGAVLNNATLLAADLRHATFRDATLIDADLTDALLSFTNFIDADLHGADLIGVDSFSVTFDSADLRGADMTGAILRSAHFIGADLTGAILRDADLRSADDFTSFTVFSFADLTNADLRGADLRVADLRGAKWCDGTCVCGEGSFGLCLGCPPGELVCTGL